MIEKNRHQTYPRPWKKDIIVTSDVTSYSDDTLTEGRLSKKDRNGHLTDSCDTFRSVESIRSENNADIRRKQNSGDRQRRKRKSKNRKAKKDNEEYKTVEREQVTFNASCTGH